MEILIIFRADLRINISLELPEDNAPQAQKWIKKIKNMREDLKTILIYIKKA